MSSHLMEFKPDYFREAIERKSNVFVLKHGEVCIVDCPVEKDDGAVDSICPGKNPKRDYDYSCNYLEVIAGYKKGLEREAKKIAEAVAKRQERRGGE